MIVIGFDPDTKECTGSVIGDVAKSSGELEKGQKCFYKTRMSERFQSRIRKF